MRVLRVSHSATVDAWRERERALRRRGHEVTLLSAQVWDEAGAPVSLRARPGEDVTGVRTWGTHPALFLYDPRPLWRALGQQWDVVDVHEEPYAAATAEVRLVRWLRCNTAPYTLYSAQNIDKKQPFPFAALERHALRSARGVSVCNTEAARILTRHGLTVRPDVIPLGVDLDDFAPPATRRPADGAVLVGYAGRLEQRKGVDVLLRAVALDPRLRVRLAGSGSDEATLQALARTLGVSERTEFLGAVPPDAAPAFFGSIDVLAVPSRDTPTWREQFGRVVVEAMACGTPVVVSDGGALPEVVGSAGVVVPQGDPAALARALTAAVLDADHWQDRSQAGLAHARGFSWEAVAAAFERMYERATAAATGTSDVRPVEVVVVAFGRADLLRACLEPVRDLPVTVVDNSSDPEVLAVCAELGVRYLDPGRNDGFGAGVNVALGDRLLPGADVLLLNPDAVISPADVQRLSDALHAAPDLASVGPAQVGADGTAARVGWPFPSPWRTWVEAAGLARLIDRSDYVIGSVLLLRAEALEQVGELDEAFFLYAEETDWARRAARRGWRHAVVDDVVALHLGAATSSDPGRREALFHAAQERYLRKHYGGLGWQAARLGHLLGAALRGVVLPGERGVAARRRGLTYLRGPGRVADGAGALAPSRAEAPGETVTGLREPA